MSLTLVHPQMGLGGRGSGTPTGLWELSSSRYRAVPADTHMQGKGALAHVCQVPVELGVRIKSGKIKQLKGESLLGAVNTEE